MDIGEVVKLSGLPASTLRFYEEKGLIKSTGRNGIRRTFDISVLQSLALIALGRNAGFSLKEIHTMFSPQGPKIDRQLLLEKADHFDKTIKQLSTMRDGLRHAAKCPQISHFDCSRFQRLLNVAVKYQRRTNR